MVSVNYSGNVIDWTDEQWDRIQQFKEQRLEDSDDGFGDELIGARISPLLKERVVEYAKEHNGSVSSLLRTVLKVLVE